MKSKSDVFVWNLVMISWQASCSSLVIKLDLNSQLSVKSTHPLAHVTTPICGIFNMLSQMNSLLSGGFEPQTCQSWASTTRPRLPAQYNLVINSPVLFE